MTEDKHTWWMPGLADADGTIRWTTSDFQDEGWEVFEEAGCFAVRYHTNECMRIGANGSVSVGRPEPYWFTTREWAEFCAKRLKSLDDAVRGRAPGTLYISSGNLGIGTSSAAYKLMVNGPRLEPLVAMNQSGQITHLNVPALIHIWWRSTTTYRVWRKLMWGESA